MLPPPSPPPKDFSYMLYVRAVHLPCQVSEINPDLFNMICRFFHVKPVCLSNSLYMHICEMVSPVPYSTYVANRVSDKLTEISDRIYCCRSGSSADTQAIADIVKYHLNLHR